MANFKLQPTKIKGKQKIKLGKLNLDISGSLRNNSVVNAIIYRAIFNNFL